MDTPEELFDTNALSILGSVFNTSCRDNFDTVGCSKTASLKFMITLQDEIDLQNLGYSKEEIDSAWPNSIKYNNYE